MTSQKDTLTDNQYCARCGKQLKNLPCYACDGKGHIREWIFLKYDCEVCNSSGKRLRCADELSHVLEDFRLKHEERMKKLI